MGSHRRHLHHSMAGARVPLGRTHQVGFVVGVDQVDQRCHPCSRQRSSLAHQRLVTEGPGLSLSQFLKRGTGSDNLRNPHVVYGSDDRDDGLACHSHPFPPSSKYPQNRWAFNRALATSHFEGGRETALAVPLDAAEVNSQLIPRRSPHKGPMCQGAPCFLAFPRIYLAPRRM